MGSLRASGWWCAMAPNAVTAAPNAASSAAPAASPASPLPAFDYDEILNCMRCGFCLPTCPTYVQTGEETASPRGRIALMKAAADGALPLANIAEQMDMCLGCLNCVTACPAGVQYGHLLEDARAAVAETRPRGLLQRLFFDHVFPRPRMLRALGGLLWLYQASGLQWLVHRLGLARIVPAHVRALDKAVPRVKPPWQRRHAPVTPAHGEPRLRVGFFTGCVMDIVFWDANAASIRLLAKAGCDVSVIADQGCCGALHAHAGEQEPALALARRNIDAFERAPVDVIVNSAGGCGAALKEYGHWFRDDPDWAPRAAAFAAKVRDVSEVLAELGLDLPASLPGRRVTMQESCHLAHGQGVRQQPRTLLGNVSGLSFCELAEPDRCCGSAGIYNLTQPDMSLRILDDKMEQVRATGADTVVTTNPGCLLQMRQGIERAGLTGQVRAVHLVELLDEALAEAPAAGAAGAAGRATAAADHAVTPGRATAPPSTGSH